MLGDQASRGRVADSKQAAKRAASCVCALPLLTKGVFGERAVQAALWGVVQAGTLLASPVIDTRVEKTAFGEVEEEVECAPEPFRPLALEVLSIGSRLRKLPWHGRYQSVFYDAFLASIVRVLDS